ncbi:MAG: hypothetical protein JWO38_5569 [Gemmataceae bacterium]|nr:hypothetical protein [Gemmataceae bacterium]
MNDPLIAQFADACGATGPLDLRVGLVGGGVLAEGSVYQPFTLIGRDDACDVTLSDPDVNPRHAWFQVVGGRVFALDLGSRLGLVWPDGKSRSGWFDVGAPVRVGPFRLQLRTPVSARPPGPSSVPDPLHSDPTLTQSRPTVQLDFRNGKRAKDRWAVNRVVTLVGRAEGCKLHLHAGDISAFHCGLVLTPSGLWVVDLSGRGVVVNGERMRVAPLPHGAELWVGRFLIGCHYPALGDTPAVGRPAALPSPPPSAGTTPIETETGANYQTYRGPAKPPGSAGPVTRVTTILPLIAEDEVPLGRLPVPDSTSGLPSSHIMCDAFRLPAPSGPISGPILVAGSGPTPTVIPVPPPGRPPAAAVPTIIRPNSVAPSDLPGDGLAFPLLQQLGVIHGQMFEQFQQSLLMMVQMVGQVHRGQTAAVQQELTRIQELNGELAKLQAEVTRLALIQAASGSSVRAALPAADHPLPVDQTPLPNAPPTQARVPDTSDAIEEWVRERIDALQKERRTRWERLTGLLTAGEERK